MEKRMPQKTLDEVAGLFTVAEHNFSSALEYSENQKDRALASLGIAVCRLFWFGCTIAAAELKKEAAAEQARRVDGGKQA